MNRRAFVVGSVLAGVTSAAHAAPAIRMIYVGG